MPPILTSHPCKLYNPGQLLPYPELSVFSYILPPYRKAPPHIFQCLLPAVSKVPDFSEYVPCPVFSKSHACALRHTLSLSDTQPDLFPAAALIRLLYDRFLPDWYPALLFPHRLS